MASKDRQVQINKNLEKLIQCENARLSINYYERLALEHQLDPEERDNAKKLIEKLSLDQLDQ